MSEDRKIALLYVEDDAQARDMLEKVIRLKFPALALFIAADGEQGLALFREHRPQLVLTDIAMPVMDGIQMTRRIRELEPHAVVIALTAYNDLEWERKSRDLNFDRCMTKPLELKELITALGSAIEEIRSTA